jgi:Ankyrin repeats (many copies)
LVEPRAEPIIESERITRALLVKTKEETSTSVHCQYVGPVYFHPGLTEAEVEENATWMEIEVTIGDTEEMVEKEEKKEIQQPAETRDDPESLGRALLSAAADGDEGTVQSLLVKGADPNFQEAKYERTALHRAVWKGYEGIVQKLLKLNAKLIHRDILGQQAIHLAAERGDEEIVRKLLERSDLNLNMPCNDRQTVLHSCSLGRFQSGCQVVDREI